MKLNKLLSTLVVLTMAILLDAVASLAVPATVSFQGRLLDSSGQPVTDDDYSITFSIWDDPDLGNQLWTETQTVAVIEGRFSVQLGSVNPLDLSVFGVSPELLYAEVQVSGEPPMSPRLSLNSVPYSSASQGVRGEVVTAPGSLHILDPDDDGDGVSAVSSGDVSSIAIEEEGVQLALSADGGSSTGHMYMVDSFFDITYRIDLVTDVDGSHLDLTGSIEGSEEGGRVSMDASSSSATLAIGDPDFDLLRLHAQPLGGEIVVHGDPDFDLLRIRSDATGGSLSIGDPDFDLLRLSGSQAQGSSLMMLDSFFDITYRIDLTASPDSSHLSVSNIGSSGEDGVSIDVDDTSSRLRVGNIGSSGQDGVSISSASSGSGLHAIDSFFDITYRIDMANDDSTVYDELSADDGTAEARSIDKATPKLAEKLCSFDDGSNETSVILRADSTGSGTYAIDSFFDITYDCWSHASSSSATRASRCDDGLSISRVMDKATPKLAEAICRADASDHYTELRCWADSSRSGMYAVDSFFDITYRLDMSPQSGLCLHDAQGDTAVKLDRSSLAIGDLDDDGRLDLVTAGGGAMSLRNIGSSGQDGVSISTGGGGGGGRISLWRQPLGEVVPIEIVQLSLQSAEPIIAVRAPDGAASDPFLLRYEYDSLSRMVRQVMRDEYSPTTVSECVTSPSGLSITSGPLQLHYDNSGLHFADGPLTTCSLTPSGSLTLAGSAQLAQSPTTSVTLGNLPPSEKLSVEGNICVTGGYLICSDERLKENVQKLDKALAIVEQMRPVGFDWKTEEFPERGFSDEHQIGFIAQELNKLVPEVVSQGADGYYSVDYGRLTAVLTQAIKEQQQEIDGLKAQLAQTTQAIGQMQVAIQHLVNERGKQAEADARLASAK